MLDIREEKRRGKIRLRVKGLGALPASSSGHPTCHPDTAGTVSLPGKDSLLVRMDTTRRAGHNDEQCQL